MPFCHLTLRAGKPLSPRYPRELKTLGDHLRKRRLDLGLLQREVAERLGADKASVVNWESNATHPALHWRPRIIEFLGYAPWDPAWTPGERLRTAREAMGLSQRRVSDRLGVDQGTVAQWEGKGARPGREVLQRFRRLLASL